MTNTLPPGFSESMLTKKSKKTRRRTRRRTRRKKKKINSPMNNMTQMTQIIQRAMTVIPKRTNKNIANMKKPSYANTIKQNLPMKLRVISFSDWLKYYKLEHYKNKQFNSPYSKNINTNLELLYLIYDNYELLFRDIFELCSEYVESLNIPRDQKIEKFKIDIMNFHRGFTDLFSQKDAYQKLNFKLGPRFKMSELKDFLESNEFNFLDETGYRSIINEKILLLNSEDIFSLSNFNIMITYLRTNIKLIKVFLQYTKFNDPSSYHLKKGLNKTMDLKSFLNRHKLLKYFDQCENNYSLNDIKTNIKKNYISSENFLKDNRMNMFLSLIYPAKCHSVDIKYDIIIKLSNKLFLTNVEQIINSKFKKIQNKSQKVNSKVRVFYISGHAPSCSLQNYKTQMRRLTFDKKQGRNLNILTTQPVGRLASSYLDVTIPKIFSDYYKDTVISNLLNGNTRKDFDDLEEFISLLYFNDLKYEHGSKSDINEFQSKFNDYIKKHDYVKTVATSQNMVNFVKYNSNKPPPDTVINFHQKNLYNDPMIGIFELTKNYSDLMEYMEKFRNSNSNIQGRSVKYNLGLEPNHFYKEIYQEPYSLEEILKYNKELEDLIFVKDYIFLSDVVDIIYRNGNIKDDEKVIIITNQCRKINTDAYRYGEKKTYYNSMHELTKKEQNELTALRVKSGAKTIMS